jgi:hypothetical protein
MVVVGCSRRATIVGELDDHLGLKASCVDRSRSLIAPPEARGLGMGIGALTRGDGAGSGKTNKRLIIDCEFAAEISSMWWSSDVENCSLETGFSSGCRIMVREQGM